MKRITTLCATLLLGATAAMAQEAKYYDFRNLIVLDLDEEMSAVWGSITGVSPNGQFAVGSDWDLTYHSWIWQADGTYFTTNQQPAYSILLDVSNDGTAVGSFYDETTGMVVPGFRTIDGVWTRLPQPAYAQTANQTWRNGQYNDGGLPYIPTAYFISGDGRHIGGWTYAAGGSDDDRPGYDAKLHGFFWHMNDAGVYELEDFTSMDLSATQQGFRPYAMNEEGTIMVGLAQRDDNGLTQPAAIIDGQLKIIIEAAAGEFTEAAERGTDEGSCFAVSGRMIYGYGSYTKLDENDVFDEGTSELYSFRYNADTGQLDKLPDLCVKVANADGYSLAIDPQDHAMYIVAPDFKTLTPLDSPVNVGDILCASDDFSVLGGLSQQFTDYGIINTALLLQYEGTVVGLDNATAAPARQLPTYDILGRRATPATRGLIIEDSRKALK